jgi:hypothetical protein
VRKKKRKTYLDRWEWRESRAERHLDELHLGERVAATLRWQGWLSTLAHARTPEGQWAFERPRILSRDIEIRDATTDAIVANLYVSWMGHGTLEFADGGAVEWAPTNFWQTQWAFFDAQDDALISFDDTSGFLEARSAVTFYSSDLSAEESALLTTFGRYLMMLHRRDSAAVAASAASAATA